MRLAKTPEQIEEWNNHQDEQEKQKGKTARKSSLHFPLADQSKEKVWVTYQIKGNIGFYTKQRYEWFCAGFLLYYDDITRNAAADHTLSFKWTKGSVTVYLDPPPDRRKSSGGKMKYPNWGERDAQSLDPSWGDKSPDDLLPSYGDTSDPPPPPPPPPPPMGFAQDLS